MLSEVLRSFHPWRLEVAESVFSNRVTLVIAITPGQTSCSGAVDQHMMDSTVLFLFACVYACVQCFYLVTVRWLFFLLGSGFILFTWFGESRVLDCDFHFFVGNDLQVN